MSRLLFLIIISACANITSEGGKISIVESTGSVLDFQKIADKLKDKHDCIDLGIIHAKTSLFPPSYSVRENEVHAALRNRTARVGGNLVIANFYIKPATGIAMKCPPDIKTDG